MHILEAYSVLGLEQGASLEVVKSAYKQIALRTHPDKNPDNPSATEEFQKISHGYRILLKHLDKIDDSDDSDSDFESEYYASEDEAYKDFIYMRIFELFMRGEEHAYFARAHNHRPRVPEESPEQYKARLERLVKDQRLGEERRKQEAVANKERKIREREQERKAAEERQRFKLLNKKADAESQRQKDAQTIRMRQERSQMIRSAVFAAARVGDTKKVEKVKDGCQDLVELPHNDSDPLETLLHIAARLGNRDLVEWLDGHGAELEERDSAGFTAFHVALQSGRVSVATYFFEEHAHSEDATDLYDPPPSTSLLSLALDSREPELVWTILDKGLATEQDMDAAWERVTTNRGYLVPKPSARDEENIDDITQLLMRYRGVTPPPKNIVQRPSATIEQRVQKMNAHSPTTTTHTAPTGSQPAAQISHTSSRGRGHGRGRSRRRGRGSAVPSAAMR
ncbi:hypothetical protein FPV67DRAFT_1463152 [Lyophyllum atratum]|nr:hypothetical protein FPV67DRAFT_1463152 [Lyophyllum atratum]